MNLARLLAGATQMVAEGGQDGMGFLQVPEDPKRWDWIKMDKLTINLNIPMVYHQFR
jgi:hypothetical protein